MKETTGKGQYSQTKDPMIAIPPRTSPAILALLKTQPFDYLPKCIGSHCQSGRDTSTSATMDGF
jgi:hypothetical protein